MFCQGFTKTALKTELKPHQKRVLEKLKTTNGLLLFHGLGAGKTLSSIAATEGEPTDVVVPASLRENYKKEVALHAGANHKPRVMSFEEYRKAEPKGDSLVIDEAHLVGRSETARSQTMTDRAKAYKKRLLLTGTPIRNQPHEIAPLLNIVRGDKEFPLSDAAFSKKFIKSKRIEPTPYERYVLGVEPGSKDTPKNLRRFKKLTEGYVDYFEPGKDGYPSTSEEIIDVPLQGDQHDIYSFLMKKVPASLRYKIQNGLPPSKRESKSLNTFLIGVRQVSNTAKPFGGKTQGKIDRATGELNSRLKKDKNFKALVYSNFLDAGVYPYSEKLKEMEIPHVIFDGSLSDKKRKEAVESYNQGKVKAILVSGAGAQGLDLKGTKLVQILEPYWNTPRIEQATGRAIRYKSHDHLPKDERHVHVQHYHAVAEPTLTEKLFGSKHDTADIYLDLLSKEKEELNNQFLDVLKKVGK